MTKILLITPLYPSEERPYYCVYIYQQLQALRECGYQVHILMPDKNLADGETEISRFRGDNIIHVGYKTRRYDVITNGISRGFVQKVERILIEEEYDLISLHFCTRSVQKAVMNLANRREIPTVLHFHGLDVSSTHFISRKWLAGIMKFQARRIFRLAAGFICVSEKVQQQLTALLGQGEMHVVYNGADAEIFTPGEKQQGKEFRILSVANLIPVKGHRHIIEAMRILKSEKPEYKITADFIGDGFYKSELQAMSEGLNINFLGEKDYTEVSRYMQSCDFYIMPSYYEAIGCVYLEAMLSGTAVLGVRGCGIDEVIEDRVNGYLVAPQSSEEVAASIQFAIENPEGHCEIAQKGYETARKEFTWKDSARALDNAYKTILKKARKR